MSGEDGLPSDTGAGAGARGLAPGMPDPAPGSTPERGGCESSMRTTRPVFP